MKLHVIDSSSKGNCYVLDNGKEYLVIECGKSLFSAKKAMDFGFSRNAGVLLTHEHGDHAKFVKDYYNACLHVYMSNGTADSLGIPSSNRFTHRVEPLKPYKCGAYGVLPFGTQHDAKEPLGYVISHPECGNILFATDTYYIRYRFQNLNNVLIECNYSREALMENHKAGLIDERRMERTLQSHMSYETLVSWCNANDLSKVSKIVLLHLSELNADSDAFAKGIEEVSGTTTLVATKGMTTELNSTPF